MLNPSSGTSTARFFMGLLCVSLVVTMLTPAARAQGAVTGYAHAKDALVKVWALDAKGAPTDSGSGFVAASDADSSTIITAFHVVKTAVAIRVDVNDTIHDLPATLVAANASGDAAVLRVKRGRLKTASFSSRTLVVGDTVAAVGFLKNDDAGPLVPHLLFPGTVSAVIRNGSFFEIDNIALREGAGGGPVFDPESGAVLGMLVSRSSDGRGGFAVAARPTLLAFLTTSHVVVALEAPPTPTPRPTPVPTATLTPRPSPTPTPRATPAPARPSPAPAPPPPPRNGHEPSDGQPWLPVEGLPGAFWLWINAGYGSDGLQSIDLYVFNDYAKSAFFYPEVRFTLDARPYDFYFNEKRIFSLAAGATKAFRLKFPVPHAVPGVAISLHEVRFGVDTGPALLPR